jgi:hypothetical protein
MAAFSARRPTRDIDLSATGFPNDIAEAEQRIKATAAIARDATRQPSACDRALAGPA